MRYAWRINATYVYSINVFFSIEASPPILVARKSMLRALRQRPRYVNETARRARRHERGACTRLSGRRHCTVRRSAGTPLRRVATSTRRPSRVALRFHACDARCKPRARARANTNHRCAHRIAFRDASPIAAPPSWTSPLCRLIRRRVARARARFARGQGERIFSPWRRDVT